MPPSHRRELAESLAGRPTVRDDDGGGGRGQGSVAGPNSVDRALQLLVLLRERGELRVQDAATALGVAPSTAHRLLTALRERDFAVQDRGRAYRPGPQLAPPRRPTPGPTLVEAAHPHLTALAAAAGETAHLVVLEGSSVRFVDGVESGRAVRVASRVGVALPAHVTSGGKALLAELDRTRLGALYPAALPLTPDARGPDLASLRRELAVVRRRGYATNEEQSEQGVNAVGTCVRDGSGRAVAAVVIAAPALRGRIRTLVGLVPDLHAAAGAIRAVLG